MRATWLLRLVATGLLAGLGLTGVPARAETAGPATGAPAGKVEPAQSSAKARPSEQLAQRELDRLARWVSTQKGELSALVVELDSGRIVAAAGENRALNPASNAKVLTAAAALARLGVDYRHTSGLYGSIRDGVVPRLVLRSDGDPSLSSRDLDAMVKQLVEKGVREVGEILVDQSRFDEKFVPPAFEQQPGEWAAFRAPVSAVSVDENSFVVRVEPTRPGKPARVTVDPAGFVNLETDVVTAERGKGRHLSIQMSPSQSLLSAKLTGHVAADIKVVSFRKRVDDPRLFAGHVLRAILKRQGVSADVAVHMGGQDEKHALTERRSEPLATLVKELGKNSDNFYAEMLLKTLSAESSQAPGSSAGGAGLVLEWMKSAGAVDGGTRVANGSGLFDANRVSAASLVAALRAAKRDTRAGAVFLDQLSVGGVDGTLRNRFRSKLLRRRVHAKTGTLARAHSLSGYVLAAEESRSLAFAILINGISNKAAEQRQRIDRVVEKAAAEALRRAPPK